MPDRSSSDLKLLARRLAAHEAAGRAADGADASAAFRVCEKLRGPLGRLLGAGGFRSLLSRSLALAGPEVAWLRGLQVKADGSIAGLDDLAAKLEGDGIAEGDAALTAQLLGLLVTFIGPSLTLHILREIWPGAEGLTFQRKESHEQKETRATPRAEESEPAGEGKYPPIADRRARAR